MSVPKAVVGCEGLTLLLSGFLHRKMCLRGGDNMNSKPARKLCSLKGKCMTFVRNAFPGPPRPTPGPRPDPEPGPGSDPDIYPPVKSPPDRDPEPDIFPPPMPQPEPMPM